MCWLSSMANGVPAARSKARPRIWKPKLEYSYSAGECRRGLILSSRWAVSAVRKAYGSGVPETWLGDRRGSPEVWVANCARVMPPFSPASSHSPIESVRRTRPFATASASRSPVIVLVMEPISKPSSGEQPIVTTSVPSGSAVMTAAAGARSAIAAASLCAARLVHDIVVLLFLRAGCQLLRRDWLRLGKSSVDRRQGRMASGAVRGGDHQSASNIRNGESLVA